METGKEVTNNLSTSEYENPEEKHSVKNKPKTKVLVMFFGLAFLVIAGFAVINSTSNNQQQLQSHANNASASAITDEKASVCAGKHGKNCNITQKEQGGKQNDTGMTLSALQKIQDGISKLAGYFNQNPQVASPTPTPLPTPEFNPGVPVASLSGQIVHYKADGSTWLLEHGSRFPIPDTNTYNCLVAQQYPDKGDMSATALIEYYQQATQVVCGGAILRRENAMFKNTYIRSASGLYELWLQSDGNIVIYNTGNHKAIWATYTPADILIQQADGNLASYKWGEEIGSWTAGTWGIDYTNYSIMQDDGNFVVYSSTRALWSSIYGTIYPTPTPTPTKTPAQITAAAAATTPTPTIYNTSTNLSGTGGEGNGGNNNGGNNNGQGAEAGSNGMGTGGNTGTAGGHANGSGGVDSGGSSDTSGSTGSGTSAGDTGLGGLY